MTTHVQAPVPLDVAQEHGLLFSTFWLGAISSWLLWSLLSVASAAHEPLKMGRCPGWWEPVSEHDWQWGHMRCKRCFSSTASESGRAETRSPALGKLRSELAANQRALVFCLLCGFEQSKCRYLLLCFMTNLSQKKQIAFPAGPSSGPAIERKFSSSGWYRQMKAAYVPLRC